MSAPHVRAMLLRFRPMRGHVDSRAFLSIGLMNAVGAFGGALLHTWLAIAILTRAPGVLPVLAGVLGIAVFADQSRFGRRSAWIGGAFGGLMGNQGGIRSVAMLELGVHREASVVTSTAIALAVDAVRLPVRLATGWRRIAGAWPVMPPATVRVAFGTRPASGPRIPERVFRRVVAAILLAAGIVLLAEPHWSGVRE